MAMSCRDGFGSIRWPDGRALLDQPMKLIAAFNTIFSIAEKVREKAK